MPDRLALRGAFLRVGLVEPMPQDRGDRAVAGRADVVAAVAGGFEPLRAVALLQSQDAETGAEALFGVGLSFAIAFDQRVMVDGVRILAAASSSWPASIRRSGGGALGMALCHGRVPTSVGTAGCGRGSQCGSPLCRISTVCVGDARLDGRADQPRRHRVIVLVDLDVIVGAQLGTSCHSA